MFLICSYILMLFGTVSWLLCPQYGSEIIKNTLLVLINCSLFAFHPNLAEIYIAITALFLFTFTWCTHIFAQLYIFNPLFSFGSKEKQGASKCPGTIAHGNSSHLGYWVIDVASCPHKLRSPSNGVQMPNYHLTTVKDELGMSLSVKAKWTSWNLTNLISQILSNNGANLVRFTAWSRRKDSPPPTSPPLQK